MNNSVSVSSMANLAAREAMLQELSDIPPRSELEKMFKTSVKHEKRILKAIKKENRVESLYKISRKFSNISVVLVICFTVFFTPVLSAKAVRESIAQTIIEWKDEFCRIFIESDAEPVTINNVEIGYIPEGYVLEGEPIYSEGIYKCEYKNYVGEIPIYIDIYNDMNYYDALIDNEIVNYHVIIVNNCNGIWFYNDNNYINALLISDDKYSYYFEGNIELNELIKIYKNLKIF